MEEDIYNYLINFGFSTDEINKIEDINEKVFFTNLKYVKSNLDFLLGKRINKENIIHIINNNPFMLTISKERRMYFDNLYINKLKLDGEDIVNILLENNDVYISSPIEFGKIINILLLTKSVDEVKKLIISNPRIINMKLDEFIKKEGEVNV